MPSRFGEFRFLDRKHGQSPPPQVTFQAQRKKDSTWRRATSMVSPTFTYRKGQIYVFTKQPTWCALDWNEGQEKQVVVRVKVDSPKQGLPSEDFGYVIRQDAQHDQSKVEGVSLVLEWDPAQCTGFLLTTDGVVYANNVGDAAADLLLQFGPWGTDDRRFVA